MSCNVKDFAVRGFYPLCKSARHVHETLTFDSKVVMITTKDNDRFPMCDKCIIDQIPVARFLNYKISKRWYNRMKLAVLVD